MQVEEFSSFNFWKDSEVIPTREDQIERIRPLSKTLCVKDYPSTNPSQVSKNSGFQSETRSNKNMDIDELFKGNSAVVERELYFCNIIHNLFRHHAYYLFEDAAEKELFLTILSKH